MDNCTNNTTKLFFMLQPNLTNLTPNALVTAVSKNTIIVTKTRACLPYHKQESK